MKLTADELKKIVADVVAAMIKERPDGFMASPAFDFSEPLGVANLYKKQGMSNLGPFTSENALRLLVRQGIKEAFQRTLAEKFERKSDRKKL